MAPQFLTDVTFSTDGGITWQNWVSPYVIGTIGSGQTAEILLRGTVSPSATENIVNTVTTDSETPDPDPSGNTSTETTPVDTSADLAAFKTAAVEYTRPGDTIIYTITVQNYGPSDAEDVLISDDPIQGLDDVQFSTDGGSTWLPWSSPYLIGNMAGGSTTEIQIRGIVQSGIDTLSNTAVVSSTTPDPDPSNNTSTIIIPAEGAADLTVTKTALPNPARAGELLTYTVIITNNGPDNAENVVLSDMLPSEITNPEVSLDQGATWNIWSGSISLGTITRGGQQVILIRGILRTTSSSVSNTVTVSSTTPDPDPSNNSFTDNTSIDGLADLAIIKTASPNPATKCCPIIYSLTVYNFGPGIARSVVLTDTLQNCIINACYSQDYGRSWNKWNGTLELGNLEPDTQTTIFIQGVVNSCVSGMINNTASVYSQTTDPNLQNNQFTLNTCIQPSCNDDNNCPCK